MADKDYLTEICKATRKAVKKAKGEIERLSTVDQEPYPTLAASMTKSLAALEQDLDKLKTVLKGGEKPSEKPAEKKTPKKS